MPAPKSQDPIRQQLIEARRNQILDAAATVFAEKGFHRATTKEIANTAGVSEGTIYNYFANKSELVIGIMTRLAELESLDEELAESLQGDIREFFATVLRHRTAYLREGQEMLQAVLPEVLTTPDLRESFYQQYVLRMRTISEQYIQARIDLGHIRPVNAALVTRAVQAMLLGLIILCIMGDEALSAEWEQIPEALATLIFDGLRPREGE